MLAVVEVAEIVLVLVLASFLVSQVVYPAFSSKPFFWIFKKSEKGLAEAEEEMADLATREKVADLQEALKQRRRSVGKKEKRVEEK